MLLGCTPSCTSGSLFVASVLSALVVDAADVVDAVGVADAAGVAGSLDAAGAARVCF